MQHFLLSTQARTLSLAKVMRVSDEDAWKTFKDIRWASTQGDPAFAGMSGDLGTI